MKISTDTVTLHVRSYEIDAYGHVNNGAYVNWLEYGREELLRRQGRDWAWYPENAGVHFVIVALACDFMDSTRNAETLRLTTRLVRLGRTSVILRQVVRREGGGVVFRARVVMAFCDLDDGARPIPQDFQDLFEPSLEGDRWTEDEGGER